MLRSSARSYRYRLSCEVGDDPLRRVDATSVAQALIPVKSCSGGDDLGRSEQKQDELMLRVRLCEAGRRLNACKSFLPFCLS